LPERVLIDCDPGHDDAIALLLALASPEIDVVGVTTVAGNQTLEKTTANAIRVLDFVGRDDIPVAAGADRPLLREPFVAAYVHGETGLDGPDLPPPQRAPVEDHAVDFLAERVSGTTLVAVGPLTNVALLFARYPEARPERLVIMGGAIGLGNVTPAAEFNIWADPEAAARVFASGVDLAVIPLEVTHQALLMNDDAERLRTSGRTGRMVAELYDFFHRFHADTYGFGGSPIHDAVAVVHVFRPNLVETKHCQVEIECDSELNRGRTVVDLWNRTGEAEPNAHVGVAVDGRAFVELLLDRLPTLD
jgi:inosine-uridine nucleoside N-ribohydrolase